MAGPDSDFGGNNSQVQTVELLEIQRCLAHVPHGALLTFLVLASYYFHPFWNLEGQGHQEQMIHFMKNLSMMGAMLFIVANGSGPMSLDSWLAKRSAPAQEPALSAQAG